MKRGGGKFSTKPANQSPTAVPDLATPPKVHKYRRHPEKCDIIKDTISPEKYLMVLRKLKKNDLGFNITIDTSTMNLHFICEITFSR